MKTVTSYLARIGRKGGKVSSPAKRIAARQNILKRWKRKLADSSAIPVTALVDGAWYGGKGRASNVGRWDAHSQCFWMVNINTWIDPKTQGRSKVIGDFWRWS